MGLPGNGHGEAPDDLDDDAMLEADEQLTLAGADERLPWLESDEEYEEPAVDTGRIVAFAAVGLLFIVLALGAAGDGAAVGAPACSRSMLGTGTPAAICPSTCWPSATS